MQGVKPSRRCIRFGVFELDAHSGELRKQGLKIKLQDQPFQILLILIEQAPELVTREELQKRIWPADTFVDFDKGLYNAIKKLREALGDEAGTPRYVETVPKRGYRFIAALARSPQLDGALQPSPALVAEEEADPAIVPVVGQTISHYRIVERLGGGGMGVVYEAEDIRLKRHVALKFLPDNLAHDPKALQRFKREAHAASSLNHPSICTIYEVEEQEGRPVIVMELLEGKNLKERFRDGPIPTALLLDLGIQTSDALAAAHAKGIIHRDIKPANIFIAGPGRVKVLDFGVAKVMPSHRPEVEFDEESITVENVIAGTTAYMSPEQVRGEEIDARSDLFSLGIVLYEAATGKRPFGGKNRVLIMNAILNEEPLTPVRVNSELPTSVDTIIAKALEKDREQRYRSATEMRGDLERAKRDFENGFIGGSNESAQGNGAAQPSPILITDVETTKAATPIPHHPYSRKILAFATFLMVFVAAGVWYWHVRMPRKLTEKDAIVLADFSNNTGEAVFDDALKQALAVDLEQSTFLNILSDDRIAEQLRYMGRQPDDRLTPDVAREVCRRDGSKATLLGSIASLGNHYVITLKAVNCENSNLLDEEQGEASRREEVLTQLHEMGKRLRDKLGESVASIQQHDTPLEQATTNSLEALQAYSMATRLFRSQGGTAALPLFKRAIELDPNFAFAYADLAVVYANLNENALSMEYAQKAYELRARVTDSERFFIDSTYYQSVTGELEKAAEQYQSWKQVYPRSLAPYVNLGLMDSYLGRLDKALDDDLQGLALNPSVAMLYSNLADDYMSLDRFDDAQTILKEAKDRKLDEAMVLDSYQLAFLRSDDGEMSRLLNEAAGKTGMEDRLLASQSDTEAFHGRLIRARDYSRKAVESAMRGDAKETAAAWRADAALREAEFGNATEARRDAAAALTLASSKEIQIAGALTLARSGEISDAESIISDLRKRFPHDTLLSSYWLPSIRAAIAIRQNRADRAIEYLKISAPYELGGATPPFSSGATLYPVYLRGEAYLANRQWDQAAAEFRKILAHRGLVWNFPLGALAQLQIGRAYAGSGEDANARIAYDDFLSAWEHADPDIPIFRQAKLEYSKLH